MRTSAAARHGDDAAVARRMKSFVCSRSGRLTVLWQQVSHVDALPRVYYFYLWSSPLVGLLRLTQCQLAVMTFFGTSISENICSTKPIFVSFHKAIA
jgi:hypothetical protein